MAHHHHHHHHHSHDGNGLASLLAIIVLVLLGFLAWGCVELGFALGLGGGVAFLAGGGIVLGGIIAAVAIGVGIYKLVEYCKRKYAEASNRVSDENEPRSNNATIHNYFSSGYTQAPSNQAAVTSVYASAPPASSVTIINENDYDSARTSYATKSNR